MDEGYEPREDDHLVEPMFEALRPHVHPPEMERPSRGDRVVIWTFPFAALVAGGLAWWLLR